MSKAKRKPPTMPTWFWWLQDGCWFCEYSVSQKGCHGCKANKSFRKEFFEKKIKGKNYGKKGTKSEQRLWKEQED